MRQLKHNTYALKQTGYIADTARACCVTPAHIMRCELVVHNCSQGNDSPADPSSLACACTHHKKGRH
jgi:hypothetical protein